MSGMRRFHGRVAIASSPWVVVFAGVVAMVVLLFVALGAYRGRSPAPDDGSAPPPALVLPTGAPTAATPSAAAVLPGLSPRASGPPPGTPAVSRSPSARATAKPTSPPPPVRPPAVSGRYRVVHSFDGGFIGEVSITNATGEGRGWTVALEYSRGRVVTAWVEGVPQGTMRQADSGFTYASGVDVPAHGSVALRFHLERAPDRPQECTVDGVRCTGF
ncbi:cellulose binding domain-containing protein [Micromonospora sp. CPCC 205539]|uniref:cellulose binding domain-containing protein n=1 Tax=Micromonospora sp. CPCC 205539 TaxID=3122408 RepID=UPI002FEF9629